jgi:tetratricopeptide (TPR) repeat protein
MRGEAIAAGYGQVMEATPDLEEAVRLSKEIADPRLLARTLTFAGRNLQWRGKFDRTITYLKEGAELARREHSGFLLGLGLFSLGHAYLAKGEYDEALRSYHELREYAAAAGDKWWITRTPNCIGAVHLELYDLDEAVRFNEENDNLAKRLWPWPEPRAHSLVKLGLAHLYGDNHTRHTRGPFHPKTVYSTSPYPNPTPHTSRPSQMMSRVASCSARSTGLYSGSSRILVISVISPDSAAMRARSGIG